MAQETTFDMDRLRANLSSLESMDIYRLISEATDILASRADGEDIQEAETEDIDPQEATAQALHRRLGDIPNVGLQTCRKLVSGGYESLADITDEPFGLTDIRGIGAELAGSIHQAAKGASDDVPAVPQQSQEPQQSASQEGNRVLAADARKEVPDGARLVADDGRLLATVNNTDDGYTADVDGQTVAHPSKGSPLGNGSGLAWAVGEFLGGYDDGNALKDEAYFVW